MLTRRNGLLAIIGLALGGSVMVPGQARAWHHGVPHGGHHDGDDRRHRGGAVNLSRKNTADRITVAAIVER